MKKKNFKKNNGITLIALVVTIIVLLILAGVSINMVLGNNGIFEKAKETQKIQALAEEKEKLENARLTAMIDGLGEVTVDSYINELIKEGITTADKVTDNGDGSKTIITENGYEVKITPSASGKDVTIEVKGDNTGSSSGSGTGNTTGNTETDGNNTTGEETAVLVTKITLNQTSASIAGGGNVKLTAKIEPSTATNSEIEWSSSNTSVAKVDSTTGLVAAVAEGTATITATAKDGSGITGTCSIVVTSTSTYNYPKVTTTNISYVGYYADLNGDGEIKEDDDGIIYADLLEDKSGEWGVGGYVHRPYSIEKIDSAKSYFVSSETYEGKFGTQKVIKVDEGENGNERFYVMALKDFNNSQYYDWYFSAHDYTMANYETDTSEDFGTGKANTDKMISIYDKDGYGKKDGGEKYADVWGAIKTEVAKGWFVPSREEWVAFSAAFDLTKTNYESYGLLGTESYWTSSQASATNALYICFSSEYINSCICNTCCCLRLSIKI